MQRSCVAAGQTGRRRRPPPRALPSRKRKSNNHNGYATRRMPPRVASDATLRTIEGSASGMSKLMRRAICGRVQTRIGARGQLRWELATSPTRPRNGRRFSGEQPDVLFGELVGDAMHDCRPDHYANEQVSGGIPPLTAALGTRRRCSPECSQPGGPGEHPHGCAGRPLEGDIV